MLKTEEAQVYAPMQALNGKTAIQIFAVSLKNLKMMS